MSANPSPAGRVAVITGGSGVIGGAVATALRDAGARAVSFDVAAPREPGVEWVSCDVRDAAQVSAAVGRVHEQFEGIDVLVHAAGVSRDAVVWKTAVEDWDLVQAVNLRGAFLVLRYAIPVMRRRPEGRIVFIGSINGSRGKFGAAAYSASKAGLLGLAKSAAREVARFGILVNVVEPGWVRTPLTETVPQRVRDAALEESLLGRFLEPAEVAAAVLFLCGPGARGMTGQILRVDGGQFLGPA